MPAAVLGPETGPIWQVRLFFNMSGAPGWEESYTISLQKAGPDPLETMFGVAGELGSKRLTILSRVASIARMTVVPLALWDGVAVPPGNYKPLNAKATKVPPIYGGIGRGSAVPVPPAVGVPGSPDLFDPATCVDVFLISGGGVYRRTLQIRGIPASALRISYDDGLPPIRAGELFNAFELLIRYLTNQPGSARGPWVLRGRSLNPLVTMPNPVVSVEKAGLPPDLNAACYTRLTLGLVSVPYKAGDRVHIGKVRACGLRGFNGDVTVLGTAPLGTVTVGKRNCCCGPYPPVAGGFVTKIVYNWYAVRTAIATPEFSSASKIRRRKTGRQRENQAGRSKKHCR